MAKNKQTAPALTIAPAEGRNRNQVERALIRAERTATLYSVAFTDETPSDLRDLPTVGHLRAFLAANPRPQRYDDVPAVSVREIIRANAIVKGKREGDKLWAKAVLAAAEETRKRDAAAKKAAKEAKATSAASAKAPTMSLEDAVKVLAAHGFNHVTVASPTPTAEPTAEPKSA